MANQRVRITDIAEELGVSTATVSNVLHGKTKKISDETVKRVQQLLEEREYIPSMAGILLAQNSSRMIGVVVNDHKKYENHVLEDAFIAASLNSLSAEIEKNGQFMMVKKTQDSEEIIRFASMWNLDGLVLIGFCEQDYMYLRNRMRIPFVVYDGFCENTERIYNITIDNYDGGVQVGTYLREYGHKRALCIADNDACVDRERKDGFMHGFKKDSPDSVADFLVVPMGEEAREKFYNEKFSVLLNYTAIFALSDYYAMNLMQFFYAKGVKVPEQISVVGFDNVSMSRLICPALTTVSQDMELRAKIAIEKLNDLKEHREIEAKVTLPVKLVVRDSVRKF